MTVQAHVGDEKNLHHAGLNQQTALLTLVSKI